MNFLRHILSVLVLLAFVGVASAQAANPPLTTAPIITAPTGSELIQAQGAGATAAFTTLSSLRDGRDYVYQVPVTGFSIALGLTQSAVSLNPAGTLAAGSIVFPPTGIDGKYVTIYSTQTVTALALSTSNGATIVNPATTVTAGAPAIGYVYMLATNQWVRFQ